MARSDLNYTEERTAAVSQALAITSTSLASARPAEEIGRSVDRNERNQESGREPPGTETWQKRANRIEVRSSWRVVNGLVWRRGMPTPSRRYARGSGRPVVERSTFCCSACDEVVRDVAREDGLCSPCRRRQRDRDRYAQRRTRGRCGRCERRSETAICRECRPQQWAWRAR